MALLVAASWANNAPGAASKSSKIRFFTMLNFEVMKKEARRPVIYKLKLICKLGKCKGLQLLL